MHMIDAETVHRLLPYELLIPALRAMHLGEVPTGDGVYTEDPAGTGNMFVTLPGWAVSRRDAFGATSIQREPTMMSSSLG